MNDIEVITSRDNANLKLARAVRDGRESDLIFIEGRRLFDEVLGSDLVIELILTSSDVSETQTLAELPTTQRSKIVKVASRLFDSVADTANTQGIIALAKKPQADLDAVSGHLTVLLHEVNNPSNLGAVVRTVEAAGASGLITTAGSADAFSPKALRASMGSAFRLPIVERVEFDAAIEWAGKQGMIITASDISAKVKYFDVDWTRPGMMIFGFEAHGLDEGKLASIQEKILIPMENEVESLNLAVSCGIVLFEAKRQRSG